MTRKRENLYTAGATVNIVADIVRDYRMMKNGEDYHRFLFDRKVRLVQSKNRSAVLGAVRFSATAFLY